MASDQEFVVVGYDHENNVYELYRQKVGNDEDIRFISFLEDYMSTFIFMMTFSQIEQLTVVRILKLKKNPKYHASHIKIETTRNDIQE